MIIILLAWTESLVNHQIMALSDINQVVKEEFILEFQKARDSVLTNEINTLWILLNHTTNAISK
jgi:hypothetical protein